MARHYDCDKCPAYCCSYARIIVEDDDIKRLADHFGIGAKEAHKQFTVKGEEKGERVLRHQEDEHFTTICQFIDPETRGCTVYDAAPPSAANSPARAAAATTIS
jgi:Fe-S-cluster containining protein